MRYLRPAAATVVAMLLSQGLLAQTHMTPAAPGTAGDPKWQGIVRMSDGRTFVTDGGLAVDVALAKPSKLPERVVSGKVLETYLAAAKPDEFGFADLRVAVSGRTYTTPKGIPLNATYINYLRRILPVPTVRFRMSGEQDPVLVVASGKTVGVLMPVRK